MIDRELDATPALPATPATAAVDLQQACGTGLQAITYLANKIALGQLDSGIAGGVDTTSDAPLALNEQFRRILLRVAAILLLLSLALLAYPVVSTVWNDYQNVEVARKYEEEMAKVESPDMLADVRRRVRQQRALV